MKKLLLAIATTLLFSVTAFAAEGMEDFKSLSAKIWKTPKESLTLKSQKHDLAIVYGGEDVSRKLAAGTYAA